MHCEGDGCNQSVRRNLVGTAKPHTATEQDGLAYRLGGGRIHSARETAFAFKKKGYATPRVLQLPEKEARLDLRPGSYDFPLEEGPRRRLADSAVDRPQGPAATFMSRRLHALAAQSLGRCTPFAASAVSTGVV